MDRHASHSGKKSALQTLLICVVVCVILVSVVGALLYYMNADREDIPDAATPNPIESKPAPNN